MGDGLSIYKSFRRVLADEGLEPLEGLRAHRDDVTGNARIKYMGDVAEICVCDRPIFRCSDYEPHPPPRQVRKRSAEERERAEPAESSDAARSARRAGQKLREYALCNELPLFCTFTLDAGRIDRYDPRAIVKKLNQWLDNRVRRNGLKYILVPEWHKDGAVHFHGLINEALELEDSGTMIPPGGGKPRKPRSKKQRAEWLEAGSQVVYNLPGWNFGFSTAIRIKGDYHQTVNYVAKYITKQKTDPRGKVAGRWYYHSNNLEQAKTSIGWWSIAEAEAAGGTVYHVPEAGRSFCYVTVPAEKVKEEVF